jgi:hypothetical protein
MNLLRLHKNTESVERHKIKFPDKEEYMKIAEQMVNNQYAEGNKRFFVYVDLDEAKIRGEFNKDVYEKAIEDFINVPKNHRQLIKPYLNQVDAKGKKKYNETTAREEVKKRLILEYFN